jgi:prepilin-type N-terminal cleavage/methylation domain-containing protein
MTNNHQPQTNDRSALFLTTSCQLEHRVLRFGLRRPGGCMIGDVRANGGRIGRRREMRCDRRLSRGFTLLELLIVIAIVLLVSALTLPTVLSGLAHRGVSESARILQAALSGARDAAIRNNAPSGIRLLPDPVLNGINGSTGLLDPNAILAANRIIPLDPAPAYKEGRVSIGISGFIPSLPYPGDGGGYYPVNAPGRTVIVLEECPFDLSSSAVLPNPPTSWFWNVRIGDQVRINNFGPIFTVVGPLNQTGTPGNSELFVNVGPPGTQSPMARLFLNGDQAIVYYPDFLFLVNGQDDNHNGWIDEGCHCPRASPPLCWAGRSSRESTGWSRSLPARA